MALMRNVIEAQLLAYLGNPIIPILTQDSRAVRTAFLLGFNDFWTNCPYEVPHSINVSQGTVYLKASEILNQDIPEEFRKEAYILGMTYLQFNPISSILGQSPYSSTIGSPTLDYMVMGTASRNIGSYGSSSNIMQGYSTSNLSNPFVNVANGSISGNIIRKLSYDGLTKFSGVNGSVEYRYDTLHDRFEFNIPITSAGVLKFTIGYGLTPTDPEVDENQNIIDLDAYNAELDKMLNSVQGAYQDLLTKYIAIRFLDIIIGARGSCNFGGADYTLDVGKLDSIRGKIESELKTASIEYGYRLMSWQ